MNYSLISYFSLFAGNYSLSNHGYVETCDLWAHWALACPIEKESSNQLSSDWARCPGWVKHWFNQLLNNVSKIESWQEYMLVPWLSQIQLDSYSFQDLLIKTVTRLQAAIEFHAQTRERVHRVAIIPISIKNQTKISQRKADNCNKV